jgi:hypothetical protein
MKMAYFGAMLASLTWAVIGGIVAAIVWLFDNRRSGS